MTDIYKIAAQEKIRFPSKRLGDFTVEQLFQLPLQTKAVGGDDLNSVAKAINSQLKLSSEESFVEDTTADPKKRLLTVALDIVKDVIATKQAENRAALAKTTRAAERNRILDAIYQKENEKLTQTPLEDLKKQLSDLDN